MLVNFKADNIELTQNTKDYAQEKVGMLYKLIANVDEENVRYEIDLSKSNQNSGSIYRADITLHAAPIRLHSVGHGESINAAIDEAKDELERRMRREKTKERTLLKRGKQAIKKMLRFGK